MTAFAIVTVIHDLSEAAGREAVADLSWERAARETRETRAILAEAAT